MTVCYKAIISGKVQGVYFRASSQQVAIDNGLSGYARNLKNGRVEVLMCGEEQAIDKMLDWLAQGPSQAEVTDIASEEVAWQEHNFFSIG